VTDPSSSRDPVEALAESFLDRFRRGERPSLTEYTARHPELADQIRALFPALVEVEGLAAPDGDLTGPHDREAPAAGPAPEQLGDYRIVRELGRGGMGVVYEATRGVLGCNFALKVLGPQYRDDAAYRRRFLTEARAAARLLHTNIVPVFDWGEQEGVLYYVMQFIPGQGLDRVLADVRRLRAEPAADAVAEPAAAPAPTVARSLLDGGFARGGDPAATLPLAAEDAPAIAPPAPSARAADTSSHTLAGRPASQYHRAVARVGVQVAAALAHAHRRGVLHRDVKPSNLLLDAAGNAWVTDFGLAKLQDAGDPSRSRDFAGTLRYMAPERFDGRSDARSDVYALGATLYEMLTLRPAFAGDDQLRLIDRILHEPPTPPRQLDRQVPRDLETIVLKALAKAPGDRYATADAMAEDLRRFLDDRTILARRSTGAEQVWRWHRRNPLVAGLLWALLLVLVGGLAGMTWLYRDSDRQRRRSEGNLRLARRTVDKMFTDVAEQWLVDQVAMAPLQRQFLEEALRSYELFAQEQGTDPAVRWDRIRALRRVGVIRFQLGYVDQAEEAYRQGLGQAERLVADFSDRPEFQEELVLILDKIANLAKLTGRHQEAERLYRRALPLAETLAAGTANRREYRRTLALTLFERGLLLMDLARYAEAEALFGRALEHQSRLAAEPSSLPDDRMNLAETSFWLGVTLSRVLRRQEAEACYRRSLTLFDELVREFPARPHLKGYQVRARYILAQRLASCGRAREAEPLAQRAVALGEQLVSDFPDMTWYWADLASARNTLGKLLADKGQIPEAESEFRKALRLQEKMVAASPKMVFYQQNQADTHLDLGYLLASAGRAEEAEQEFRRGVALHQRVLSGRTTAPELAAALAVQGNTLAWFWATSPLPQLRDPKRSLEMAEKVVELTPEDEDCWRTLGVAHYRVGNWGACIKALEKSMDLRAGGDALDWFFLAMARHRLGDTDQACSWYDRAVRWMEEKGPQRLRSADELRRSHAEAAALLGRR
jgi:serine/threonine protein kinase/Flp pilus assembly protein TadD